MGRIEETGVKHGAKSKATTTVSKPVTHNPQKSSEEKRRFDEAATARARTRQASRHSAMAKDPFAHEKGKGNSRKRRTVGAQTKPPQQNVRFKASCAEPLLCAENAQSKVIVTSAIQ